MAGIGFTLRKALGEEKRLGKLGIYGAAAFVAAGPWLLTLISLFLLLAFGKQFGLSREGGDLFFATVTYAMIGSNLISSTAQFFLTRYLADALYVEAYDRLLSAFTGVFFYTGLAATVYGGVLQSFLPLPLTYKIWTVLLTVVLTQLGLMMILLSAAKSYGAIARAFLLALVTVVLGSLAIGFYVRAQGGAVTETHVLALFTIGQTAALLFLGNVVVRDFPGSTPALYGLKAQHRRYPQLVGIGFFYALTLWVDNGFYWASDMAITVRDSYWLAPSYDLAKFWTYLAFIPSFTLFSVSIETNFYLIFRGFYDAIERGETLATVRVHEEELRLETKSSIWRIAKIQSFVALVAWVTAQQLAGVYSGEVEVFAWTVLGSIPHMIWITTFLFLLYFDARSRALLSVTLTTVFLVIGTWAGIRLHWPPGIGYLAGCIASMAMGLLLLNWQTERLLYYAFHDPNKGQKRELPPAAVPTKRQQRTGYPQLHPLAMPHDADGTTMETRAEREEPAEAAEAAEAAESREPEEWHPGMELPPRSRKHGRVKGSQGTASRSGRKRGDEEP